MRSPNPTAAATATLTSTGAAAPHPRHRTAYRWLTATDAAIAHGQAALARVCTAMFQDARLTVVLVLLTVVVAWGVGRTRGELSSPTWLWVWGTLLFLIWLLGGLAPVRAAERALTAPPL